MEFIVAIKWPLLILLLVTAAAWRLRSEKRRKALGDWLKRLVESRDISLTAGPAALAITSPPDRLMQSMAAAAQPIAGEATAELPAPKMKAEGEVEAEQQETMMRREAVEQVMRSSAEWGWEMAQLGMREPPAMELRWRDDGRPEIHFDYNPASPAHAGRRRPRRG
jgi:hypothetical protein